MGHPTPHSCTDLSVYCYLLNSLLIATLLLPIYKPALLFFLSRSLNRSHPRWLLLFLRSLGLFRSSRVVLPLCFGLTRVTPRKSVNRLAKRNTCIFNFTCFSTRQPRGLSLHLHKKKYFLSICVGEKSSFPRVLTGGSTAWIHSAGS